MVTAKPLLTVTASQERLAESIDRVTVLKHSHCGQTHVSVVKYPRSDSVARESGGSSSRVQTVPVATGEEVLSWGWSSKLALPVGAQV
jgi:ferredoxin-fold anticodon binding domain-containing protein